MNEREAMLLADRIVQGWPAQIQASVDVQQSEEITRATVRIQLPRENRVLRLGHPGQLPGVLDVCTTLLGSPAHLMKGTTTTMMLEQRQEEPGEAQQSEDEVFSEEEAATYLGVKVATIRTYVSSGTLQPHPGGFLLEELRRYKEQRRPKVRTASPQETGAADCVVPHKEISPSEEARIIQAVVAHAFSIPGVSSLGRLSETKRSWKVDVWTEHGPASYRVMRTLDGEIQHERW